MINVVLPVGKGYKDLAPKITNFQFLTQAECGLVLENFFSMIFFFFKEQGQETAFNEKLEFYILNNIFMFMRPLPIVGINSLEYI